MSFIYLRKRVLSFFYIPLHNLNYFETFCNLSIKSFKVASSLTALSNSVLTLSISVLISFSCDSLLIWSCKSGALVSCFYMKELHIISSKRKIGSFLQTRFYNSFYIIIFFNSFPFFGNGLCCFFCFLPFCS